MLRITVDLIKASTGEVETLATAKIVNDGTGTSYTGNYTYEFYGKKRRIKHGKLVGFNRSRNAWWLIFYCLKLAFWENMQDGDLFRKENPQGFKRMKKPGEVPYVRV